MEKDYNEVPVKCLHFVFCVKLLFLFSILTCDHCGVVKVLMVPHQDTKRETVPHTKKLSLQHVTVSHGNKTSTFLIESCPTCGCLLWDHGGTEPFGAEHWCLRLEGSALTGPGRSGNYLQWLKQKKNKTHKCRINDVKNWFKKKKNLTTELIFTKCHIWTSLCNSCTVLESTLTFHTWFQLFLHLFFIQDKFKCIKNLSALFLGHLVRTSSHQQYQSVLFNLSNLNLSYPPECHIKHESECTVWLVLKTQGFNLMFAHKSWNLSPVCTYGSEHLHHSI